MFDAPRPATPREFLTHVPPRNAHTARSAAARSASARPTTEPRGEEAAASGEAVRPPSNLHHYPFYSPRFWHGMRPAAWYRLLRQGHFRISPSRLSLAIGVTAATPINSGLALLQQAFFARRLRDAELHGPPVFIVGHWRSGTTLLHELMVRDERLSSPSTFQCFAPHHFLLSEWFFRRFAGWLLPGKRPMDNMDAGWDRPQEDEFALVNLGLPSPYRRIAFPNEGPVDLDYLDFEGVSPADRRRWMETLRRFLLAVSTVTGRPLVIKSPTHTGRVGELAQAFPDAKFIHITRDPRALFPSTCRLWQSLDSVQGLQRPHHRGLESHVIEALRRMYASFHRQREQLDPQRIFDVRYEDLTARPLETLRQIYETLRLADFDTVEPVIQQWASTEHRQYQTNRHQLTRDEEARIREAWRDYFTRYGYE